ncbi:MAG: hypothetical protein HZB34_03590 [Nitrospirae bacterium]|nr:hypothetical protein [Nitrospirota bacterium]
MVRRRPQQAPAPAYPSREWTRLAAKSLYDPPGVTISIGNFHFIVFENYSARSVYLHCAEGLYTAAKQEKAKDWTKFVQAEHARRLALWYAQQLALPRKRRAKIMVPWLDPDPRNLAPADRQHEVGQ